MKKIYIFILLLVLIYTRFVGLDWGLPYSMHPDERNMAASLQQLRCSEFSIFNSKFSLKECFNPHFFAYGQFPLYLGYIFVSLFHLFVNKLSTPISFDEATVVLRIISSIASLINVYVLYLIVKKFTRTFVPQLCAFILFIFSPYFIQFSHFGTTESLLMLLYCLIIYYSLLLMRKYQSYYILLLGLFTGLAISIKISSVIFLNVPLFVFLWVSIFDKFTLDKKLVFLLRVTCFLLIVTAFCTVFFSPHNVISFNEFLSSMRYESDVALGRVHVFYTRQFDGAMPLLFQAFHIFPYALGFPVYLASILGFLFLSWRKREINILRVALLIYLIPTVLIYAKWTRFVSPIFPVLSIFAVLFVSHLYHLMKNVTLSVGRKELQTIHFLSVCMIVLFCLPGLAYLAIYQYPDVRFKASEWIYENIHEGSYILSETANVVDIPIPTDQLQPKTKHYTYVSFYFYDLDRDPKLQYELASHLEKADYIFVPSRRIFKNHSSKDYPLLTDYYKKLFTGRLKFYKIAEFSSYPRIELFGQKLIEFPDEEAEETWTVFDHPVVRVYKKL